jgi:hypothetical protein
VVRMNCDLYMYAGRLYVRRSSTLIAERRVHEAEHTALSAHNRLES